MKDLEKTIPEWQRTGLRYYPLGMFMRQKFGEPVWKVCLDAHLTCPNIDGTVGRDGCVFCNAKSYSPGRRLGLETIKEQIEDGMKRLQQRHSVRKFIAYFQPSTNTHAPVERLATLFGQAVGHPGVVGLAIGTRPDALPDDVLDLLEELSRQTEIFLEIGLQSAKNSSLQFLNRGHNFEAFEDAVVRAQKRHLLVGAHLILGIPGETPDDMIQTSKTIARFGLHSIKLHHLYVVRETKLAERWLQGQVPLLSCEEYAQRVVDFLEYQSPETVVERVSGEADDEFLLAPAWTAQKHAARNAVELAFRQRQTWQGRLFDNGSMMNFSF